MKVVDEELTGQTPLQRVLELYPGAQRALFQRYHIGGCRSCGFQPEETLAQLAERNGGIAVPEMIDHIRSSHEHDQRLMISPSEVARLRLQQPELKLLDVRTREEYEAARIEGALLLSQPLMQEILAHWPRQEMFFIVDHQGQQGLDAAAYFLGHGFENVRCLRGGIDAWSQEVDPAVPRYQVA